MRIKVTQIDEDENVSYEGYLNKREASFLLHYALNDLLNAGVEFMLDQPYDEALDDEDADKQPLRFNMNNLN